MDLPITIHSGISSHSFDGIFHSRATGIWAAKFPVIGSMHALFQSGIPDKYPRLRFGFVEAAASWVPYLLTDMTARAERMGRVGGRFDARDALKRNRFYVTCQTEEDLPYIISWAGEDNLVIGSDYSHADTSSQLEALRILNSREDITPEQKKKILEDNPAALYGI
jgi:predicted TIM-barrel fold metal-dependent hydrolase